MMAEKTHCLREQKCSLQAIKKASEITGTSARAFVLEKETPLPNEIKINRHPFDRHFEIPLEHVNLCIEPVWIKMGLASHLGWDADKEANNFRVVITRLLRSYLDSQRAISLCRIKWQSRYAQQTLWLSGYLNGHSRLISQVVVRKHIFAGNLCR